MSLFRALIRFFKKLDYLETVKLQPFPSFVVNLLYLVKPKLVNETRHLRLVSEVTYWAAVVWRIVILVSEANRVPILAKPDKVIVLRHFIHLIET